MLSSLISDPASAAMQPLGSYTQPPAVKKTRRLWERECFELCRRTNRTNRSRSPSLVDEGWSARKILLTMAFHARQNSISFIVHCTFRILSYIIPRKYETEHFIRVPFPCLSQNSIQNESTPPFQPRGPWYERC